MYLNLLYPGGIALEYFSVTEKSYGWLIRTSTWHSSGEFKCSFIITDVSRAGPTLVGFGLPLSPTNSTNQCGCLNEPTTRFSSQIEFSEKPQT